MELDVQMTRDGVLVLHHDRSLIRMAGVPEPVSSLTHEEVMDLEIGSSFSEEFKGERIPTLEEALELIGDQGEVLLDVKTDENKEVVAKKILSLLDEKQMKDRAYIQSFDYEFLRLLRAMDGEIRLGQIMYAALGRLELLDVDFYTVQMNMLSRDLVRRAHEADRGIFVWVIKTEDQLKDVLQYDISGVIISDPLMASDILGGADESVLEEAP
jgi:glycerophosphoryl diester phosphodiesterase